MGLVIVTLVWGLEIDFFRLGVNYFYVLGLVFFTFEGESLLRLGISYFYIWGLVILTFGGLSLLQLGISSFTFGG